MNKFLLVFNDGRDPVGLNTENQVRTYLQNSVPDVTRVSIYTHSGEAVRDGWSISGLIAPTSKFVPMKHAKRWSEQETLTALTMRKSGKSHKQIAEQIGRTVYAVQNRLHKFAP